MIPKKKIGYLIEKHVDKRLKGSIIGLSLLLLWVNIAHGTEEITYGFDQNFGVCTPLLGYLFAFGYVLQASGCFLIVGTRQRGYLVTGVIGLLIAITATEHHFYDVMVIWPYRMGVVSKILEVSLMIGGALLAVLSMFAFTVSHCHAWNLCFNKSKFCRKRK